MTFNEALTQKQSLAVKTYELEEGRFDIMVTPNDAIDLDPYLDFIAGNEFSDQTAILFSKNDKFKLRGVCYDGASINFDDDWLINSESPY